MPRPPHNQSVLRQVREATGLTQERFAGELDVSAPYVRALELGVRPLTPAVADRLLLRYGIVPESLLDGGDGPARSILGAGAHHDLPGAIARWQEVLQTLDAGTGQISLSRLVVHLEDLFERARTRGQAGEVVVRLLRCLLQIEAALEPPRPDEADAAVAERGPEGVMRSQALWESLLRQGTWGGWVAGTANPVNVWTINPNKKTSTAP